MPPLAILATLQLLQNAPAPTPASAAPAAPPAVMRSSPDVDQVRLSVGLYRGTDVNPNVQRTPQQLGSAAGLVPFVFDSTTIAVPIVTRTSWCDTDLTGLDARTFIDGRENKLDAGAVFHRMPSGIEAQLRFGVAGGQRGVSEIRVQATFLVQRWEVSVDENLAATSTWPRAWPGWADRYLGKELGIDPTDAGIKLAAEQATPGGPRSVSPYLAARNAVLAVVGRWKALSGGSSELGPDGTLRGIAFSGTQASGLAAGRGTPVELAVTCVAAVRALGIPSRVVYCVYKDRSGARNRPLCKFRYVCEFFLNDVGWIPFDPAVIRTGGGASPARGARGIAPVKGFANVDGLEDALPLAYRPIPDGYVQADRIAVWGWEANRVDVESDIAYSRILLDESSRGNGKVPSMPAPVGDGAP